MSDRIFLRLGENGALGADDLQWIFYKPMKGKGFVFDGTAWRGVSFVRSTKAILERCIREKGIELSPDGSAGLASLAASFDEWKAGVSGASALS